MESIFDAIEQNLESMLGVPFVSSAVTLGLAFYAYKAAPELHSFVEELFLNVFFQIIVGFMVLFMSTGNVLLSFIVSAVFVYLLSNTKEGMIGGWGIHISHPSHHSSPSLPSAPYRPHLPSHPSLPSLPSLPSGPSLPSNPFPSPPSLEDLGNKAIKIIENTLKDAFKKFRDNGKNVVFTIVNSISYNVEKTKNNIEEKQKLIKPL